MRDLEAARYAVDRAFRQYDAADPTNRLVAAELKLRWNRALAHVNEIEAKIVAHDAAASPRPETAVLALDALRDKAVWSAPTTDARLKKRIVRTVIQEVVADIDPDAAAIVLLVHWVGAFTPSYACCADGAVSAIAPRKTSSPPSGSWSSSPTMI
jgi:hypothetical protein